MALRLLMHRFEPSSLRSFPLRDLMIRSSNCPSGKCVEAVRVQMWIWANHSSDSIPPYASPRLKKERLLVEGEIPSIPTTTFSTSVDMSQDTGDIVISQGTGDMSQGTSNRVIQNATKLWAWTCNACSFKNMINADQMKNTRFVCTICQTRTSTKQVQTNIVVVEDEEKDYHDISSGQENVAIRMYGEMSTLKKLKNEFLSYITSSVLSPCVRIKWKRNGGVRACMGGEHQTLKNICSISECSHKSLSLECNRYCECASIKDCECGNRITQRGIGVHLEVFWTGNDRRWGVRALQSISKGQFVCVYAGEIVPFGCKCEHNCDNENCVHLTSCANCVAQGKTQIRNSQAYVFELKPKTTATTKSFRANRETNKHVSKYVIDGRRFRNVGPFFNHACSGWNIEPRFMYSEHHDTDLPILAFFAKCNIKANEEILLNYGHKFPGCMCKSCAIKKKKKMK